MPRLSPRWATAGLALLVAAACSKPKPAPAPTRPDAAASGPKIDPNAPADVKGPPPEAVKHPSGLASRILAPGTGTARPASGDIVRFHYTGWTTAGVRFDSSLDRRRPASLALDGKVMAGWTEGLQHMTAGEKRRFWIPPELAYGGREPPPQAPRGMLVFDVELLSFQSPPRVPPDVAAIPKSAKRTKSGLAYRVLAKGTGKEHPKAESVVRVNYSGWTTDGKMFDTSASRGGPASFPVGGAIPGWSEGVQLMTVGEKRRFWIPAQLAYGDKPERPGAPAGMLVFDVELVEIKN
jgi:peptidylprolyl isomerase